MKHISGLKEHFAFLYVSSVFHCVVHCESYSQITLFLFQEEYSHIGNPCNITAEEYFDDEMELKGRDIGRPKEVNTKVQKFKVIKILNLF
jgi:hypothetical protein